MRGSDTICDELRAHAGRVQPSEFRTDPDRTAPRRVTRAGTEALEAIFRFETRHGRGIGVLRLTPDAEEGNRLKAWTLLTALDELKGFEERIGRLRPRGRILLARFSGPELARSQEVRCCVHRPGPGRAGRRRRAGRAVDGRAPRAIAGRYADRGPRTPHRRQLAQALSRPHPAQPGAGQPPSLHAISAELADLHPQGQACRLVRGLCGKHGAQLLASDRTRGRQVRRTGETMVRRAASGGWHQRRCILDMS